MTNSAAKTAQRRELDFPFELLSCGIRQDGRRLFLPLMCLLSLLLTILVLWGAAEGTRAFRRAGTGAALLPFVAGTVFTGMFVVLGLNIPFALRAATADDDLPLIMLTGVSPLALWRARVCTAAIAAWAIPLVHLPILMFLFTMGGIKLSDFGCVAVFWFAGWLFSIGWASLAGCVWTGAARDRMQGMALTLTFGFLHGMALALIVRVLFWMNSPWSWWVMQSFQPPWRWTNGELARLAAHVLVSGLAAWTSVIVLRGRWRSAVEAGSHDRERSEAQVDAPSPASLPLGDVTSRSRAWAPPRPRCGNDPWFWKDFHVSGGSWKYWWVSMAMAVGFTMLAAFFCAKSVTGRYVEPVIAFTMIGWFIWMMFEVGRVLTIEFQDRMWSLVRITPNSVSHILWSKLLACALKLTPSFLPLGLVCLFGLTTYAYLAVTIGLPVLMLLSLPIGALILYGSAIPQTLIGAGWPMVKTLVPLGIAIVVAGIITAYTNEYPRGIQQILIPLLWACMSLAATVWLMYCTIAELNNPARERLSSDGG